MALENKRNIMEVAQSVFITIIVIAIMIFCCLAVLSQFNIQINNYYKNTCDKLNGTLYFWECYNSPMNNYCDLDTTKKGTYCILNNGTEVDINIKNIEA